MESSGTAQCAHHRTHVGPSFRLAHRPRPSSLLLPVRHTSCTHFSVLCNTTPSSRCISHVSIRPQFGTAWFTSFTPSMILVCFDFNSHHSQSSWSLVQHKWSWHDSTRKTLLPLRVRTWNCSTRFAMPSTHRDRFKHSSEEASAGLKVFCRHLQSPREPVTRLAILRSIGEGRGWLPIFCVQFHGQRSSLQELRL